MPLNHPIRDLVRLHLNGQLETLMIKENKFQLHGFTHTLVLFSRITKEFAHEELKTWKNIIRLINHELANTLGPLKSLLHSAQKVSNEENVAKLPKIYNSMDDILDHLHGFLQRYADFARLPQPVAINPINTKILLKSYLLLCLKILFCQRVDFSASFDAAQMQQVVINLLKNAQESGSSEDKIKFELLQNTNQTWEMIVFDAGKGMGHDILEKVTLPFFSTKPHGSGVGLALCREIAEAHQGELRIHSVKDEGTRVRVILPC